VALSAALSAQSPVTTAYPQASLQNSGGTMVALGCDPAGAIAEGHSQILIPPQYLPGPGAILTGLAVHCQSTLSLSYPRLKVTVSPTTLATLGSTFASNLSAPQVVLDAAGLTVGYDVNAWTPITFTTPYVHDGVRGLVIDIEKIVNATQFATMSTTADMGRSDLPLMVYQFGSLGSGASTSTAGLFAAEPLVVELEWFDVSSIRLKSDPSGANNNQFALGGSIEHTLQATPGSLFVNLIGTALNDPALPLPPVLGLFRVNGSTLNLGNVPPAGSAVLTLTIPAHPRFVGLFLGFQSLTLDAVSSQLRFTNAVDCFVNS
jgi:hypothetical protein